MLSGAGGYLSTVAEWLWRVRPGGSWDYKAHGGTDDQGNFNYGATGSVLFPRQIVLRGAGLVQGPNPENRGNWYDAQNESKSSYGDQPRDQRAIKDGIDQCGR
jgi:hypothetical protein